MSNERWDRIGALFDEALDLPGDERSAWLAEACGDDEDLRREVESLLAAHGKRGILEKPLDPVLPSTAGSGLTTAPTLPGKGTPRSGEDGEDHLHPEGREGELHVGPYRLLREIGQGGMGVVYQAHDPRLDRHVALKFLPPQLRVRPELERRFFAEAKASSALDHPNICTIYDVGETDDGQLYIAMAYYEGETLAKKLAAGPLEIDEAVGIAVEVAEGLSRSHEAGIIHRDIKPPNVMVTERDDSAVGRAALGRAAFGRAAFGRAKILDFGIAKLEGKDTTRPGSIVGTVSYMSPEQLHGGEIDHRTDLFSLGAVLYEMLTGHQPFPGEHPVAVIHAVLHDEPRPIRELRPEVPAPLAAVVRRALSKLPARRQGSAAELAAELAASRARTPLPDSPPGKEGPDGGNLPPPLTGFLGREREIGEVRALLERAQLVTLTGPVGTGKTRLAIEAARGLSGMAPDGIFFVDLSPIRDPGLVPAAVLHALGLSETPSRGAVETLRDALRPRRALLVLDNLEQVVDAEQAIAELLDAAPDLKVLATSRAVLRLSREHAYPVAPLALPEPGSDDVDALAEVSAVALFCERARAANPGFRLTAANAPAVAEICVRLDGMPLAIELAAARTRLFQPAALLQRLGRRLDLLKTGARDSPERHRTLRQAIAWSYDLLAPEEQAFFRRLSIFDGGASLEAAAAVAGPLDQDDDLSIEASAGIAALLDHSLLLREDPLDGSGEPRFVMLDSIRELGCEKLRESGEWAAVDCAHAEYLSTAAKEAGRV